MKDYIFTSESVSEGHPDKVCDQISDAVLDAYLKEDPNSRVACETLIKNNLVVIAGEITSQGSPDLEPIVRKVINDIGYNDDKLGFNGSNCEFVSHITKQSPNIAQGVNEGQGEDLNQGAGDQGIMFGFACNETSSLMPAPIDLSHQLVKQQSKVRKDGILTWLRPDAKSQVSVIYDNNHKNIKGLSAIVLSTQHDEDISYKELKEGVFNEIIKPIIPAKWITDETKILINPTGKFVIGGPVGPGGGACIASKIERSRRDLCPVGNGNETRRALAFRRKRVFIGRGSVFELRFRGRGGGQRGHNGEHEKKREEDGLTHGGHPG